MTTSYRAPVAVALVVLLGITSGVWLLAGASRHQEHRHVVVGGVPLDEVHPAGLPTDSRRPGVVVAHGYAGSARLMAPFGDTLAAQGYVVVLLDFAGHGANTRPLPDGATRTDDSSTTLQDDLDVALAHLRSLPDVDPARVALVGHSMGATAVTRYAITHPDVTATAAISLPDADLVTPERPQRLLVLVGGLEFAGFRAAAEQTLTPGVRGRSMVVVAGVEHIGILYAPRTHREIATWLRDSFGGPAENATTVSPLRRPLGGGLLLLALLVGLYPVASLLLGGGSGRWTRTPGRPVARLPVVRLPLVRLPVVRLPLVRLPVVRLPLVRLVAMASVASVVAMPAAAVLPTVRLPLAIGGYVVGFTTVVGLVLLGFHRWRPLGGPADRPLVEPLTPGRQRVVVATGVLVLYAAVTIALPLQLGLTHVVPVGPRWWLLGLVWAGFAVLAYAAERVTGGRAVGVLIVSAIAVTALTVAGTVGLTSGFVLLVAPLLAVLLLVQAIWSAVLHRFAAPAGLIAVVGALLVAWPIATALPLIG